MTHDEAEFRALVVRHHAHVFGAAVSRCRDRALAEDITQEAFLRAWLERDALREPARAGAWVAAIASNLAASEMRRRVRRARRAPHVLDEQAPPPDAALADAREREALHRALGALPPTYREPVRAFYLEGKSVEAIAQHANASRASIRQRLRRARDLLRSAFAAAVAGWFVTTRARAAARKVWWLVSLKKSLVLASALVALLVALVTVRDRRPTPAVRPAAQPSSPSRIRSAQPPPPSPSVRRGDPASVAALRRSIDVARTQRAVSTRSPELEPEVLDEHYVRAAVREIAPMVMECFEAGIARGVANDGDIVVRFTIEGEADLGGVITDSAIDDSTIVDPTVQACIRDTMFALQIDAPPSGGVLEVRKRFTFHALPGSPATLPSDAGAWR